MVVETQSALETAGLRRHPVSQRSRDDRGVRHQRAKGARGERHRRRRDRRRQRSKDGSGEIAAAAGATVVHEPRRGYGSAYLAGLAAASGDYIVMVDADLTYDFREIPASCSELEAGAEIVIGNRMDGIQPGAMPWRADREPDPVGLSQHAVPHERTRCALRHARAAAERTAVARPAHDGDGVRIGDGDPGNTRAASTSGRYRSSCTRASASRSSPRFATAGDTSASSSSTTRTSSSSSRAWS